MIGTFVHLLVIWFYSSLDHCHYYSLVMYLLLDVLHSLHSVTTVITVAYFILVPLQISFHWIQYTAQEYYYCCWCNTIHCISIANKMWRNLQFSINHSTNITSRFALSYRPSTINQFARSAVSDKQLHNRANRQPTENPIVKPSNQSLLHRLSSTSASGGSIRRFSQSTTKLFPIWRREFQLYSKARHILCWPYLIHPEVWIWESSCSVSSPSSIREIAFREYACLLLRSFDNQRGVWRTVWWSRYCERSF